MIDQLAHYLGRDRYQSILDNKVLTNRSFGSVLFADISGFTPLTDKLIKELGPRRGIEQLGIYLNLVYDKLIDQVDRFGGSIVSFSGDAITCYFDDQLISSNELRLPAPLRAIATATAIQATMQRFMNLALNIKISIATGNVSRFAVGNPEIQLIDTLAGETLQRMAQGEELAHKGELLIDQLTADALSGIHVAEKRGNFSVVQGINQQIPDMRWPPISFNLKDSDLKPWIVPEVFNRLKNAQGEFITELKPCTSLFLRFTGIDYDNDPKAEEKLNILICWAQNIFEKYEATFLALTIGDKGSYLQAGFGVPITHENDTERAMNAALELKNLPKELSFVPPVQIGISQGMVRAGAYGGKNRRAYAVMGNDVNLAARLMQKAEPGQILVSQHAQKLAESFTWGYLPSIKVKGREEEIGVFSLLDYANSRTFRLHEPAYSLPMVGRKDELELISQKLDITKTGSGQIVAIVGEAGMGKSRLVTEVIRLAKQKSFFALGGECQSHGTNTPYLVWQNIWRGFFDLNPNNPEKQIKKIKNYLEKVNKDFVQRLPLLDSVLGIDIEDNALTKNLDVKLHKESLESLLVDLIKAKSQDKPLFIVLEDLHWLDSLSHDLLEMISRVIEHLPIMILVAYRPPELERLQKPRIASLSYFTEIRLNELNHQEAKILIKQKLNSLPLGEHLETIDNLTGLITEKAQGNPFFIEEIIRYLQDKHIEDIKDLEKIEVPDSLHTLILSRIDQLTEREKFTLKVASIIGRVFRFSWLYGYYPVLGNAENVKKDLEELRRLELTPLDTPEPELTYIFKHIVTREVAYESLSYATRSVLHEQLASWLEKNLDNVDKNLDLLAYHYENSENLNKKKYYLRKAGESAQANYANQIAVDYYQKLLKLTTLPKERAEIIGKLAQINEIYGNWSTAEKLYHELFELSEANELAKSASYAAFHIGSLLRQKSSYENALVWLNKARFLYSEDEDRIGFGQTITELAMIKWHDSQYEEAKLLLNQSLILAKSSGDKKGAAFALSNLGRIAYIQGDYEKAIVLYKQARELSQEIDDRRGVAFISKDIAGSAWAQGKYDIAWEEVERSLHIYQEIGDKQGMGHVYSNMGVIAFAEKDYEKAYQLSLTSLNIAKELGNKWASLMAFTNLGHIVAEQGDYKTTWQHHYDALILSDEINEKQGIVYSLVGIVDAISATSNDPIELKEALIMLAVSDVLREKIGLTLEPDEKNQFDRAFNRMTNIFGKNFGEIWEQAKRTPLEEAIELGLKPRMYLWNAESGS